MSDCHDIYLYIISRSRQRFFRCRLQCQINMNLVFHISEDGSEIPIWECISAMLCIPLNFYENFCNVLDFS